MTMWRFYDKATGLILARQFTGSEAMARLNTPNGYAWIPGDLDHMSQRIDITATPPPPILDERGNDISPPWYPPAIDYQPPAPANDAMQTWAWDAQIKRWVSQPTLAAIKRDRRQAMAAAWDEARRAGVTVGTKVAPTDADAWTRYLAIQAMASDASAWVDVPIQLLDGTFELLTKAKAAALWTALKDIERTLLARLKARVEAIAAASTAAEVNAVTW